MTRKAIRVLAVAVAIIAAGLGVVALTREDEPRTIADTQHGNVAFAEGQMQRILNAADATMGATSPDELVAEGRALFRETARFEQGETCQNCHGEGSVSARLGTIVHDTKADDPEFVRPGPQPPSDFDGPRDAPALWGLAETPPFFWNGNVEDLTAAVVRPVRGHMKDFVRGDCSGANANSDDCNRLAGELAAKLVAYIKTLDPPTSDFDLGTMSLQARAGEKLFQGKGGCIECHGGPLFTDNGIHNTGVPQVVFRSPYGTGERRSNDQGAPPPPTPAECQVPDPPGECEPDPRTANSAFINTPQLRDVKNTAPYMHNGSMKTLREVVEFYNRPSSATGPLNLSEEEIDQIVAFLEAL
jgi:cytochrome c peroxidase